MRTLSPLGPVCEARDRLLHQGIDFHITVVHCQKKRREPYPKASNLRRRVKGNLGRSWDGFLSTGSAKELLETEVKPLVEACVQARGRGRSPENTRMTQLESGFDCLGQPRRRSKEGKMLIPASKKHGETV